MTRIVLSGCEGEADYDVLMDVGCKNILITYMHVRKAKVNPLIKRRKAIPDLFTFVDSGGYTLRNSPEYLEKQGITNRQYAEQYIEWLYENKKYISCAANLDIQDSDKETADWADKELKKFEQETGVPIIYVWHSYMTPGDWESFCIKHRYIGFSGTDTSDNGANRSAMLAMARKHGTWVHGFGITDVDSLGRDLFYSVDSTTWIMGAKYGRTMAWTGTEFRQFDGDNKQRRQQYRQHFIDKGVNWDLIEADGRGERGTEIRAETLKMNAIAWMDYQDFVTKRMAPRAYWHIIDNIERRIPDVDKATASELKTALVDIKYPVDEGIKEADTLRVMWSDLFMFARRDEKQLKDLDKEDLLASAKEIDKDFSETDRERIIDFLRMDALNILVPGASEKAKQRDTAEAMTPTKERPKARENEEVTMEDNASTEVELPNPVDGDNSDEVTEPQNGNFVQPQEAVTPASTTETIPPQTPVYPDFIQGLGDETLQLRARLLVDATRRQISARVELNVLRLKRAKDSEVKRVKKLADAATQEVRFIEKQLPADARKKLTEWLAKNAPTTVAPEEKKTYAITTANASQLGKLGGAPKGNINAMRHGIYSKKLPALACDTCPIAGQCYMHRPGHVCSFDKEFKKLQITDIESAIEVMRAMANTELERSQRQLLFETVQGGVANTDTTALLNSTFSKVDKVRELMRSKEETEAAARAAQRITPGAPVTMTETKTVSGPAAVLASLIQGALANKPKVNPTAPATEDERKAVQAEVLPNE